MAIDRLTTSNNEHLDISINNGDMNALREAVRKLGFADEERMLRYLLAVITKSATRSITITDQNGAKISLNPSADLLATPPIQQ
ncbi:hypothetical protein A3C60_02255 [Candidatus Nomurabacteria bacterium RIFCSPHIGHO2_02_FULL_37_45]|uniref:Uncharacterized protein n=2 Tax=Candidatus Nomuraibacteriota TaxID=1752729 RepID=A0A1F6Y4E8_9BACT|nr:MAG: hypothetical protein A2727_00315 [Candidatus Nomurabacteria bacterium RIFCSPHIGHO2_01_FULL_37_110]OGI70903.1 MAG: hypothetical protein A3C60_02255 [Candidatus Nomurabacteria bacterium RIFCSPHIGHO2_02_FULL_37_45]OGI79173.1 MAG: hypothetical protein A3F19_00160 [Candidatus Nomurabacteria bacterium RIFCSPHIGHO2_12_FULL_37_29]OGI84493.1 MAG: hypothetical protein A3A92_01805 [Candidatus Nomurabacteria bacterium RIFCSPLOWO2_01_FULL_37_49]OGJ01253.1 MAG: hypothetical protein A3G98_00560 [Candi